MNPNPNPNANAHAHSHEPARSGTGGPAVARVHLAIAGTAPARLAIDAAVQFACALGEEIDCVFVEHADLFRAAALPPTREVGLLAAGARRFDPADLVAALHRQAEHTRRELERAAQRARVHCRFEVVRGELLRAAIERSRPDEIVVVAAQGLTAQQMALDPARLLAALEAALGQRLQTWHGAPADIQPVVPTGAPSMGSAQRPAARTPRPLALQRASLAAVAPELERVLRRLGGTIVAGPNGRHG